MNSGKINDVDPSSKKFSSDEAHHLRPVKKEEFSGVFFDGGYEAIVFGEIFFDADVREFTALFEQLYDGVCLGIADLQH